MLRVASIFSSPSMRILLQRKLRQVTFGLLIGLIICFVLELVFYLLIVPRVLLQKIVLEDSSLVSEQEIKKLLGFEGKEYYFLFDEQKSEEALQRLSWVDKVDLQKIFPHTLKVNLVLRKPLALCLAGQNRNKLLMIDREGMVYESPSGYEQWDLPLVSFTEPYSFQPGTPFARELTSFFLNLDDLKSRSPALYQMISEIELRKNERENYDVIFYPQHVNVRLILENNRNFHQLHQAFVLLDLIRRKNWTQETKEIDLRTSPVVFRSRKG